MLDDAAAPSSRAVLNRSTSLSTTRPNELHNPIRQFLMNDALIDRDRVSCGLVGDANYEWVPAI